MNCEIPIFYVEIFDLMKKIYKCRSNPTLLRGNIDCQWGNTDTLFNTLQTCSTDIVDRNSFFPYFFIHPSNKPYNNNIRKWKSLIG